MDFPPREPPRAPTQDEPAVRVRRRPRDAPAPARRRRRPRRETMARVGVAIPWILFAIFIVAVGGIVFAAAMIGLAAIGLAELFRMTRRYQPIALAAYAVAAAMVVAAY